MIAQLTTLGRLTELRRKIEQYAPPRRSDRSVDAGSLRFLVNNILQANTDDKLLPLVQDFLVALCKEFLNGTESTLQQVLLTNRRLIRRPSLDINRIQRTGQIIRMMLEAGGSLLIPQIQRGYHEDILIILDTSPEFEALAKLIKVPDDIDVAFLLLCGLRDELTAEDLQVVATVTRPKPAETKRSAALVELIARLENDFPDITRVEAMGVLKKLQTDRDLAADDGWDEEADEDYPRRKPAKPPKKPRGRPPKNIPAVNDVPVSRFDLIALPTDDEEEA